jgi:hypothetical protein
MGAPYNFDVPKAFPWQPGPATTMPETVCLNFGGDLHLYASGYREGAEALLEVVRSTGHSQDVLVYPIVYSLRHSVELLLKQVIRASRLLLDEQGDFPDGHRLNVLWNTCKPLLQRVWADDPAYATVETAIMRLCEIDPEGEAFRYPIGTKKEGRVPTLDSDLVYLDLGGLVRDVIEATNLLDGADTGIDYHMEAKYDMLEIEREMRAEYEAEMRAEQTEYEAEMREEYAAEMHGDW